MVDRFDIARKMADAPAALERQLDAEVEDTRDAIAARKKRLIKLSVGHYYDPLEKLVLSRSGSQYTLLDHDRSEVLLSQAKLRPLALEQGFKEVEGGFFWNVKLKHLYVKNGGRFVLYSLNRRKTGAKAVGVERRKGK